MYACVNGTNNKQAGKAALQTLTSTLSPSLTSIKRYMYIFDNLYNLILIFTAIQEGNVRNQECNSKFSSAMQNTTANTHLQYIRGRLKQWWNSKMQQLAPLPVLPSIRYTQSTHFCLALPHSAPCYVPFSHASIPLLSSILLHVDSIGLGQG